MLANVVEIRHSVDVEDLRHILSKPRNVEFASMRSQYDFLRAVEEFPTTGGTLLSNSEPIIAAGITQMAPKGAMVWLVAREEIKNHALTVVRQLKLEIAKALDKGWTLRTNVAAGQDTARRFIEYLGFKQPPGKTYWELKK